MIKFNNKKSVIATLSKFDYLCSNDSDFIEVTQWTNYEGYDITIGKGNHTTNLSLTIGELDAIDYLTKTIEHDLQTDNKEK